MPESYVGEIRMFAGNYAPAGWMFCMGQYLPISQYDVLYNLIGTTYGGDGVNTFALPDLQGRIPLHQGLDQGNSYVLGDTGGTETVTLATNQIPSHTHYPIASAQRGNSNSPSEAVWARSTLHQYSTETTNLIHVNQAIQPAGGSQTHNNMMPYLCVNFIISLYGSFPTNV